MKTQREQGKKEMKNKIFNSFSVWTTGCFSTNKNKNNNFRDKIQTKVILTLNGKCRIVLSYAPDEPDSFYAKHRKIIQNLKLSPYKFIFPCTGNKVTMQFQ
jgi:hypothetical protein